MPITRQKEKKYKMLDSSGKNLYIFSKGPKRYKVIPEHPLIQTRGAERLMPDKYPLDPTHVKFVDDTMLFDVGDFSFFLYPTNDAFTPESTALHDMFEDPSIVNAFEERMRHNRAMCYHDSLLRLAALGPDADEIANAIRVNFPAVPSRWGLACMEASRWMLDSRYYDWNIVDKKNVVPQRTWLLVVKTREKQKRVFYAVFSLLHYKPDKLVGMSRSPVALYIHCLAPALRLTLKNQKKQKDQVVRAYQVFVQDIVKRLVSSPPLNLYTYRSSLMVELNPPHKCTVAKSNDQDNDLITDFKFNMRVKLDGW